MKLNLTVALTHQAREKLGDDVGKETGNLLYHMATRFKGSQVRCAMLLEYVCSKKISSEPQLTGMINTAEALVGLFNLANCGDVVGSA